MSLMINGSESENRSLKDDLKRCELEAKQLNSQLDSVKTDYEQLVHDRDREISRVTAQLDELRQDKDILIRQRDQSKQDLMACNKQLDLLKLRVDEQDKRSDLLMSAASNDKEVCILTL